jgi:2-iminobutanoate/2-iminopropanoate deaminase
MAGTRAIVNAQDAPAALGPYSHAVACGGLLFCSGQIPLDPQSGEIRTQDPAEQARVCLANLAAVCEAAGTSLARALRVTVYMTDLGAFAQVNEAYAAFFGGEPPARVAIGVAALPRGAQVEIDAVVAL